MPDDLLHQQPKAKERFTLQLVWVQTSHLNLVSSPDQRLLKAIVFFIYLPLKKKKVATHLELAFNDTQTEKTGGCSKDSITKMIVILND